MTAENLVEQSQVEARAPGRFAWHVPGGWEQGRGAYGGIVLAAMTRAMLEGEDPERRPRSLSASLMAPVEASAQAGEAEIKVERLRVGNAVTTTTALLVQGGEIKAHAMVVTGRDRASGHRLTGPPPALRGSWRDVPVSEAVKPPLAPIVVQHWEIRALPPYPFGGGEVAEANAWVRPRVPWQVTGAPELAALSDVLWPGTFAIERGPRPTATIAFHLAFGWPERGALDPSEPLFHRGVVVRGSDGYFTEVRELWTASGELVCHNPQVFAWIK